MATEVDVAKQDLTLRFRVAKQDLTLRFRIQGERVEPCCDSYAYKYYDARPDPIAPHSRNERERRAMRLLTRTAKW